MLAAMEADGDVQDEEVETLEANLARHPIFEGMSRDELSRLTDVAADAIRDAGGGKQRIEAIAAGLPSRNQRLTAYTMACDVCVSDRVLAEAEIDFLDRLQTALGLGDDEAKEVFEAARKQSGLLTLEEKSKKVLELMPSFVQCMALMAAADGEIHKEERLGMRKVLDAIPDMRVLTPQEIEAAIDIALERVMNKDAKAELAAIANEIPGMTDRYWIAVYVMIIAHADGKTDWREIEFLARLKQQFGLEDSQMDIAMKTAAQFPMVELGGESPS
ncbi:MAG TPA: TerB family tellurite resistance protein [Kofleriaceae bacterium]|nr:TerB family tellurite resistance protein [Kofleriaceae bacterium]